MPKVNPAIPELVQLAIASFDRDTWDIPMRRVIPVAVYVDGANARRVGMQVSADVRAALASIGYTEVELWGTHAGSFLQLNLCRNPVAEDGPTFAGKIEALGARLRKINWKRALKLAGGVATIVVAVGGVVYLIAPAAVGAVVASYPITTKVWVVLAVADKTNTAAHEFKGMFVNSPAAKKALIAAQAAQPPKTQPDSAPESTPSMASNRDFPVRRKPYNFKPARPPETPRNIGPAFPPSAPLKADRDLNAKKTTQD